MKGKNITSEFISTDRKNSTQELTALIVDLHRFTKMCAHDEAICMGQFIRDIFYGSVKIVEGNGGVVVNTMGDAVLCIFDDVEGALFSSWGIIRDFWNQHEYLVGYGKLKSDDWGFIESGVFCRCAIETGCMEKNELPIMNGALTMWTGNAINYVDRIIRFPEKVNGAADNRRNTLVVGPKAFNRLKDKYSFDSPIQKMVKGEKYIAYPYDTRDLWGY